MIVRVFCAFLSTVNNKIKKKEKKRREFDQNCDHAPFKVPHYMNNHTFKDTAHVTNGDLNLNV